MKETIFRCRSVRFYQDKAVDQDLMDGIIACIGGVKRLYPEICVLARVLEPSQITMAQSWRAPHCLSIYSEQQPAWLENTGFMFQQLDLYLQAIGLGSCWVGLGKPDSAPSPDGMEPVILMPFGYPKNPLYCNEKLQYHVKSMEEIEEIADYPDERLEAARVAPSAPTASRGISFMSASIRCMCIDGIRDGLCGMS